MANLIDGKAISKLVREEVARAVEAFKAQYSRVPGLHVVLVGEDPASAVYVRNKEKAAAEVGIAGRVHRLPASTAEDTLLGLVRELNQSGEVDGILVQFPGPGRHPPTEGDRDHRAFQGRGRLASTKRRRALGGHVGPGAVHPPRLHALDRGDGHRFGWRAGRRGRAAATWWGKPIAGLLLAANATVTLAHSKTRDLPAVCRGADVLVAAVGRTKMIPGSWIKPGAVVIDVGMNRDEAGKLCGDVDFDSAVNVASAITPVPGGVGR